MKKLAAVVFIVLFAASFGLSSCNQQRRLCPAYPPSTFHGDTHNEAENSVESLTPAEQL